MSRLSNRKAQGFTLIELLVVVLILAILMAVALPAYLSAVADSSKKTCRANMQTIANAVQAARVKDRLPDYTTYMGAVSSAKEPDLPAPPVCPDGGIYTVVTGISPGNYAIHCSIPAHVAPPLGDFEPGRSSQ